MRVDLDLKRLDSFGHRLHSAINLATIGIMTASLVIGSSIVMTVAEGPTLFGIPLLTFFGCSLPDRFREQPLDHPFDLAPRSALREAGRARAHFACQQVGEIRRYWSERHTAVGAAVSQGIDHVLPLLRGRPTSAQGYRLLHCSHSVSDLIAARGSANVSASFRCDPRLNRFSCSATFRMRRAHVRELLQDVGVGLEAGGRTLIFCQESNAVIDHSS